jgi:phosphosulfolactate synthase
MNNDLFQLKNLPERTIKPRNDGFTMVMDKGLSIRETEDFLSSSSSLVDIVKLGFGTGLFTQGLLDKIRIYQSADIPVYFGGTLFEAYLVRNQLDDYHRLLEKTKVAHVEISDGSLEINHDEKCEIISTFAKNYTVLSEVGSKDAEKIIPPYEWIEQMETELEAGAWKVKGTGKNYISGIVPKTVTQTRKDIKEWLNAQQLALAAENPKRFPYHNLLVEIQKDLHLKVN